MNPFQRAIPPEFQMIVDSRIYKTKLDDSYMLGRIVKRVIDSGAADFRDGEQADEFVIRAFKELDGGMK